MAFTKLIVLSLTIVNVVSCFPRSGKADERRIEEHVQQKLSLNGPWQFSTDSTLASSRGWTQPGFSSEGWDVLTVPGNWDTENDYANFVGTGYYRKEFVLPSNWDGSVVRLCFGAVYQTAEVWLNGEHLGKHVGGYTPFEFDVTQIVKPGDANVIALTANNEYRRGAWWHWGGISREVHLVCSNQQYIVWQHVTTEPDLETGRASVSVAVRIKNCSSREFRGSVDSFIQLLPEGSQVEVARDHSISVAPNSEKSEHLKVVLDVNGVQLWDISDPKLYRIQTTLKASDASVIHAAQDRFGIRKIEAKGAQVLLNGKAVRLNGFNRVSDHWAYGQTEPDELVKFDIDAMKAMGCHFTRIMHYPQAKNLLDYCDEVGMLLIEEIPVWGKGDPQLRPGNALSKQWLSEMIIRDYNHPCIIGWSVANEVADGELEGRQMSPSVYGYVATMIAHVASLDSTRLKTYASFTAGRAQSTGVDPADVCDIVCINSYGEASRVAKRCHEVWPDKPIFVTEIGKTQIGEELSQSGLAESLKGAIENLRKLDYVVGCSLWTYNDYRSSFGGTPIGQCRTWGVYNTWRQPKRGATEIQQLYAVSDQKSELESMHPMLTNPSSTAPAIQAVVPLKGSCMVGFSVLDKQHDYEIEYTLEDGVSQTVKIIGLRGAAKVYGLEPGEYLFRIRCVSNGVAGEWSAGCSATVE